MKHDVHPASWPEVGPFPLFLIVLIFKCEGVLERYKFHLAPNQTVTYGIGKPNYFISL